MHLQGTDAGGSLEASGEAAARWSEAVGQDFIELYWVV